MATIDGERGMNSLQSDERLLAPPLPPRAANRQETDWISETAPQDRICILRDFLKGQPDYNIRVFVLRHIVSRITFKPWHLVGIAGFLGMTFLNVYNARTQLCHAFGLDGQFLCFLSATNPYSSDDDHFKVEDLYHSLSILRVVAIIEGLLVFFFAFSACAMGAVLTLIDWRQHHRQEAKWDPYHHDRFLWWAVRWGVILSLASQFSLLCGLACLTLIKTEPLRLGKRLIRKYPHMWGMETIPKVMIAALLTALLFGFGIVIGIIAVWAKLQLARVGVTLPHSLGLDPSTGQWTHWTFGQVVMLLGLANNIAGLFALGSPNKITSLLEYRIDPKLFAGALLYEHGFVVAAAIWFAADRREVRKALRDVFVQLVPEIP
ncbi:uncharacterized protein SPPG_05761 [Spizellomyces punctatus DAOM BR117]|uniref:Uncharacterized protein n=1 Tax=Spizellomyces punctatus (strain DAOM BR117) TaxID=645134 RepID=A0A0L0HC71_SPIPD|nr:uncharacterized protein SPPG_05761 [Spizellomyces punctatus DAOM BR117]KNC98782.1 hypothetical protein SPPG_05761 [Spizellomyces punctatus DAOM BR117]|eukprot:XP_016606822.1 hypothetical protein SPPG_05761 [Spizellomyces punctatus DAOM BR117]